MNKICNPIKWNNTKHTVQLIVYPNVKSLGIVYILLYSFSPIGESLSRIYCPKRYWLYICPIDHSIQ